MSAAHSSNVLVFPVLPEMNLDEPSLALRAGESLILASSVLDQFESDGTLVAVHRLPNIHDDRFRDLFLDFIRKFSIRAVYCPVTSVYAAVARMVEEGNLQVSMVGRSPHLRALGALACNRDRARRILDWSNKFSAGACRLSLVDVTAMVSLTSSIYGECSDQKLAGLIAAAEDCPAGELVEIGVLFGRSAVALGFLADRFNLGQVLAVDPWNFANAVQHDSPALIQQLAGAWNLEDVYQGFLSNASMLSADRIRHCRMDSVSASTLFAAEKEVQGRISFLHIDGNHDEAAVRADCGSWFEYLLPGAWIVLDDYEWVHGAGPKVVGNELLQACSSSIERYFIAGKALFIKIQTPEQIRGWAASFG